MNRGKGYDLPSIVNILAFLAGVLLFLLFGESLFGIKPNPYWIAGLIGLSVSLVVIFVWGEIHHRNSMDE